MPRTSAGVAHQRRHRHAQVLGHALDHVVALGVNGAGVQRVVRAAHAQEARRLLEGLGPQARAPSSDPARRWNGPFWRPVLDDVLGQRRARRPRRRPAAWPRRCSPRRRRRSRRTRPRRRAPCPAAPGSRRAGTARRRSTWDRSSPARPADPAGAGRWTPRRARSRPGRAAPRGRSPRPNRPRRRSRSPTPPGSASGSWPSFFMARTKLSVSRPAVPLPMAIASSLWRSTRRATSRRAASTWRCGSCG